MLPLNRVKNFLREYTARRWIDYTVVSLVLVTACVYGLARCWGFAKSKKVTTYG